MALYANGQYLRLSALPEFNKVYSCGQIVPKSGIYICTVCGYEATCNAGDPFPPQSEHRHEDVKPPSWKLIVATQS